METTVFHDNFSGLYGTFALNRNRVSCRISKNRKPKPQYACQEAFYAYTCLVIEVARSYLGINLFGYMQ